MEKLLSNKKVQIVSVIIMALIFILLFFTKWTPYGIKISAKNIHEKGMNDSGIHLENILLVFNIIIIVCTIILNILFCMFSKKKAINISILTCFIICSIFIPVVEKNSYDITIAGVSNKISNSQKCNIIDLINIHEINL